MSDFKRDLKRGAYYETKSINILLKHGFKKIKIDYKYNPYYDLKAYENRKRVYIEVKYNSLTDKTNKIFLECCKFDKTNKILASGISITKATYYIFYSYTKYYMCNTQDVKRLLERTIRDTLKKSNINNPTYEQLRAYIEHNGLRTQNTIGILISVDDVINICKYNGIHLHNTKNIYTRNLFK